MTFTINAQDFYDFALAANLSWGKYKTNMTTANTIIRAKGIEMSRTFAPHDQGPLRASIKPIGGVDEDSAEFGTDLIYAWQREEGGTIEGNPYLVFQVKGRWVKVRSVYQEGSHYMAKTMVPLRPFALYQWGIAIDKMLSEM